MTPEIKPWLVIALNWITAVLSILLKMAMAFMLVTLLLNPYSKSKDYLAVIAIAVVMICVEQRIRS